MKHNDNAYLKMPLDRVRQDAIHGVSLARIAWRQRDPNGAALVLGHIIEPGKKSRKVTNEQ
jgi:hypothetical protein